LGSVRLLFFLFVLTAFISINGLHLYSAFTDPMATKALYILPHIHSFIHIHTPTGVSAIQGTIQLVGSSQG